MSQQGAILIDLLAAIGACAWRGLGKVDEGLNRWTPVALGLTLLTLVFAALGFTAGASGIVLTVSGRTLAVTLFGLLLIPLARRFAAWDMQQWLWETWRFVMEVKVSGQMPGKDELLAWLRSSAGGASAVDREKLRNPCPGLLLKPAACRSASAPRPNRRFPGHRPSARPRPSPRASRTGRASSGNP